MTAANVEPPRRPALSRGQALHRFTGRLLEVMDGVDSQRAWTLSLEELAECVREAYAAQARLAELTLALVAQAEAAGLAPHDGVVDLVAWLRQQVRLAPAEAKRQVALARALGEHPVAREALAAGAFPAASAQVIVEALDALPEDLEEDLVERAMNVQQGGTCAVEGCTRPAIWGEAHHLEQWQSGGRTDLKDGVLICRPHHTYADHPDYRVEPLRPGRIRLHRRQ